MENIQNSQSLKVGNSQGNYQEITGTNNTESLEKLEILEIRKTLLQDIKAILQIQKDCYLEKFGQNGLDETNWQEKENDRKESILSDKSNFLVATLNKEIVGSANLTNQNENYILETVFIKPKMQKRGIGTLLIQTLLSQTIEPKDIYLQTNDAQEFYQKVGFEDLGNGKMILKKENWEKLEEKIEIRKMHENDKPQVKQIIMEGWRDSVFFEIDENILRQNCERSSFPALTNNNYQKFVCVKNSLIIGYLAIQKESEKEVFWIGDFYIKKEFRKQGIGQFLFNFGLDFAKENSCKEVFLYLDDANSKAAKFYAKFGFEKVQKSQFEWLDMNGKVVTTNPEHLMKLNLAESLAENKKTSSNLLSTAQKLENPTISQDNPQISKISNNSENLENLENLENPKSTKNEDKNYKYDYIIVNFANPDMVGHTGDIAASIKSMEFLDEQLGRLVERIEKNGHEMIIIADHGNMEFVGEFVENGKTLTDTEHNPNPVPCIFVGKNWKIGDQNGNNEEIKQHQNFENRKQTLLQNIEKLKQKELCNPDLELMKTVLTQKNQVNLENAKNWLTDETLTLTLNPQMPLWYAGAILLGL